jgi:hypothetical protein
MDWILETEANDRGDVTFKNQDAIVIAHNFKGYDGQFIHARDIAVSQNCTLL